METMTYDQALAEAFPAVDAGVQPLGSRVLVQIKTPKAKTASGIILVDDTKDTEKWNTTVAKVIDLGPLAFKNRDTMKTWPEGSWVGPGDFVRAPKYGGDRWSVRYNDKSGDEQEAMFVILNDLDIVGLITGDPLAVKAFI